MQIGRRGSSSPSDQTDPGRVRSGGRVAAIRTALLLVLLGIWAIVAPYMGFGLALTRRVPTRLEVVDHVVPGLATLLATGALLALLRRPRAAGNSTLWAIAVCAAAGFWITGTHVLTLRDAARGFVEWQVALWHLSPGPPILALAARLFLLVTKDPGEA